MFGDILQEDVGFGSAFKFLHEELLHVDRRHDGFLKDSILALVQSNEVLCSRHVTFDGLAETSKIWLKRKPSVFQNLLSCDDELVPLLRGLSDFQEHIVQFVEQLLVLHQSGEIQFLQVGTWIVYHPLGRLDFDLSECFQNWAKIFPLVFLRFYFFLNLFATRGIIQVELPDSGRQLYDTVSDSSNRIVDFLDESIGIFSDPENT